MVEYQGGGSWPQVAVEHHWTRTDLLRQVCIKAGLADDIWQRRETRLYGFTAQVFTDSAWRVQTARLSSIQATPEERRS
jgi:AMMECR1 domain-containing protein